MDFDPVHLRDAVLAKHKEQIDQWVKEETYSNRQSLSDQLANIPNRRAQLDAEEQRLQAELQQAEEYIRNLESQVV